MKLYDAALCADCDELVSVNDPACPSCTSTKFLPLTSVIEPLGSREEINLVRFVESVS